MLLSDICEIIMGQSPSSDSYNVKGQGLPFFQGNADFGKLYPSVRLWCNCPIKKAEAGDLLVSVRAPIGAVNLANQKCCIGRGLAALRPYRDKCDAMYLYYLIKAGKNKLNWLGTGSTFKAITRSSLLSFNVPDYCIAFQRKISGKLWSVDKLIHQRNEQLKLFDLLIQSRFIEMFGDSQSNPKGFSYKRINEFAKCIAGATPSTKRKEYWSNGIIPWMSSGEVNYKRIWETEKRISQVGYDSCSTKMIPAHTVVIAMAGHGRTRGTVAVAEIPLCTNQSLCSIITDGTVDTDYLFTYLQFQYNNLRNISNGSSGRGGLNIKLIGQFAVLVPPLAIQQKFSNFLKEIDKSWQTALSCLSRWRRMNVSFLNSCRRNG